MNTTHTQGPWIAEYRNRSYFDIFAPSAHAADSPRASKVAEICSNGNKSIDEMRANARLIAAAPETAAERDRLRTINSELVDILARLVSRMHAMNDDRDPLYRAIVYDADKAITRARGTA
jgi:hypothetical protein